LSRWGWNISREGDSTASLGSLFQSRPPAQSGAATRAAHPHVTSDHTHGVKSLQKLYLSCSPFLELLELLLGPGSLRDFEDVEADSLAEGTTLPHGDDVPDLDVPARTPTGISAAPSGVCVARCHRGPERPRGPHAAERGLIASAATVSAPQERPSPPGLGAPHSAPSADSGPGRGLSTGGKPFGDGELPSQPDTGSKPFSRRCWRPHTLHRRAEETRGRREAHHPPTPALPSEAPALLSLPSRCDAVLQAWNPPHGSAIATGTVSTPRTAGDSEDHREFRHHHRYAQVPGQKPQ